MLDALQDLELACAAFAFKGTRRSLARVLRYAGKLVAIAEETWL